MLDLDYGLALLHHFTVFAMVAVMAGELIVIRQGMTAADLHIASRLDAAYGGLALAILAVGFARAIFAAKGWEHYSANPYFHAKIGAFVAVGLLSIWPTVSIIRWRKKMRDNAAALPAGGEIAGVRKVVWAEMAGIGVIIACAAAMARG